MRAKEIEAIKNDLVQCLNSLSRPSNGGMDKWAGTSEPHSDVLDQANHQQEMDFAFYRRSRQGHSKRMILSALHKIEAGDYGICEACEKAIPATRLKAIPDAIYCCPCQEQLERAQG